MCEESGGQYSLGRVNSGKKCREKRVHFLKALEVMAKTLAFILSARSQSGDGFEPGKKCMICLTGRLVLACVENRLKGGMSTARGVS